MIGIIGAMVQELNMIKTKINNLEEQTIGIKTFYKGTINNKEVVVVLAGIGKVNAAITTSVLIENFNVTSIVNIGVAGGQNGVKHKDVVISTEVLHHDVDVTAFGNTYVHGQVPGMIPAFEADTTLIDKTEQILQETNIPYIKGRIASGDQFVTSSTQLTEINKLYDDIYAVEMESAAIAQTAYLYSVPFIIYRSISDIIDDKSQSKDFHKFVDHAANNAARVLVKLIEVI